MYTMGLIKKQGVNTTVISYVGAFIGAITVMFIYPYCMNVEEIGLFRFILDAAGFFGMLSLLGSSYSITYFFPNYSEDREKYNQFVNFIALFTILGFLIVTALFIFGEPLVIKIYDTNSSKILDYFLLLLPIILINNIYSLLESHALNIHKVIVPKIGREILVRFIIIALILLYFFKVLSFVEVVYAYIFLYGFLTVILLLYVIRISPHKITFTTNFHLIENKREIIIYSVFIMVAIVGSILSNRLDSFFLTSTVNGLAKNGIYTTVVFMIMMMDMPIRSLLGISTPIINESIKNNDWDNIEKLYKKSSIVLLVVSIIILAVLWCNIDAIFAIMPKGGEFKAAKYLLLILGVSKLIDAITSINSVILNFSKHYKYSLILTLILGLFTVLTAYLLIPTYGLIGAAFSTAISMAIFQILLTTFVFIIYKKHPFTLATFKVLASFGIMICVVYFLPNINPFLTIAYKTLLIAIFSYLFIFRLRLSNVVYEEISSSINSQYPALKFLL